MKGLRDGLKKRICWHPDRNSITVAAVLLFVLVLLPLLRLSVYAVPWYDDYNYGAFTRTAHEMYPGLKGVAKGVWDCIRTQWYAWQGTFSSIFFMALMPAVWGEECYPAGPVFLILLLAFSVFALQKSIVCRVLQAGKRAGVALAAGVASMVLLYIHTAQAGFYWYNAGVHYVGMHAFLLLLTAVAICLLTEKRRARKIGYTLLSVLLGFVCAGANYVTALQGLLLLLSLTAVGAWLGRKNTWLLCPSLVAYGAGFFLNVSAPGNQHREAALGDGGMNAVQAVAGSFREAFLFLGEFTGVRTLLFLLLLLPLIYHIVSRTQVQFSCPWLVLLWSFCFYATGFTPSLYSLGHAGFARTLNAVKITYQLLLVWNEIYWLGFYVQRKREKKSLQIRKEPPWWYYAIIAGLLLWNFGMESNQAGHYSSYGAYYYVHTGEACHFHQEYLQRVELLKSDEKNIVLEPYRFRPWFLCISDLSDNPEEESNRALAAWYDKESVVVRYD